MTALCTVIGSRCVPSLLRAAWLVLALATASAAQVTRRQAPAGAPQPRFDGQYDLIDLGFLPGFASSSSAVDVNDAGAVLCTARDSGGGGQKERSFLWQQGVVTDLGALPGHPYTVATAMNASGVVVGYCHGPNNVPPPRAFRWEAGTMVDLGLLPGTTESYAEGINASGAIVGYCKGAANVPFLWDGTLQSILFNATAATAWDVSDAGLVWGNVTLDGETFAGYMSVDEWHHRYVSLNGRLHSTASGLALGSGYLNLHYEGFALGTTSIQWLPTISIGFSTTASGMNDQGQLVGTSAGSGVSWVDGELWILGFRIPLDPGWLVSAASAINDQGWIVGTGAPSGGPSRAVLLRPL